MGTISLEVKHIMQQSAGAASAENGMGGEGSSSAYLTSLLNRLDSTLKKLDSTISSTFGGPGTGGGGGNSQNSGLSSLFKSLAKDISVSIATAVGVTVARYLNNQASAVMSRASNIGGFTASAIAGNANQAFGQYASQFVQIEAQRRIANVMATGEGAGGVGGAAIGATIGGFLGMAAGAIPGTLAGPEGTVAGGLLGRIGGARLGAFVGTLIGGGVGASGGKLVAAEKQAQFIQADALAKAALAQRNADAAISQWKTGFSRFGLGMTNTTLVGGDITGGAAITAPLQAEFMHRYGSSQNFNAIQNQIVPFLTTNPLSHQTGDLNNISQQFLKAGFAVSDFSRLTMQSSQYVALTGKTFQDFTNDLTDARAKFGDAYDTSTNQTALNLMQLGIGKDQAQHLANQSLYNPGVMSGVSLLANSTYAQFYQRKALSGILGFDPDKSLAAGQMVDANGKPVSQAIRSRYLGGLKNVMSGKGYSLDLAIAGQAGGINIPQIASFLQRGVPEGSLTAKMLKTLHNPSLSPGQQAAFENTGTMQALLNNVQTAMINAGSVTLYNTGAMTSVNNALTKVGNALLPTAPMAHGSSSYTPTKH